jgi:hypothetical protein
MTAPRPEATPSHCPKCGRKLSHTDACDARSNYHAGCICTPWCFVCDSPPPERREAPTCTGCGEPLVPQRQGACHACIAKSIQTVREQTGERREASEGPQTAPRNVWYEKAMTYKSERDAARREVATLRETLEKAQRFIDTTARGWAGLLAEEHKQCHGTLCPHYRDDDERFDLVEAAVDVIAAALAAPPTPPPM